MEKLIDLLNEYVEKHNKSDLYYKFELENGELYCYNDVSDVLWTMQDEAMVICSKKFGFIKWLVENEKIDYEKIGKKIGMENDIAHFPINKYWYVYDNEMGSISSADYSDLESLLMLLSIQDEPIEFLVSILK